jgi:hypothetical protein
VRGRPHCEAGHWGAQTPLPPETDAGGNVGLWTKPKPGRRAVRFRNFAISSRHVVDPGSAAFRSSPAARSTSEYARHSATNSIDQRSKITFPADVPRPHTPVGRRFAGNLLGPTESKAGAVSIKLMP